MNISFLTYHIEKLLEQILTFKYPADGSVRFYFKQNTKLGSKDRQFIADALFNIIRNLSLFRSLSQTSGMNLRHSLALLGLLYNKLPVDKSQNYAQYLQVEEIEWLNHVTTVNISSLKPTIAYSMPEWLWQSLNEQYKKTATDIAVSMLLPSNLDVRVNTLKTDRDTAMEELYQQKIMAGYTPYAPNALRLEAKVSIHNTQLFEAGWFEIQDEGSQLLCHVLNPKRGEMVVDFCAGSGGKTLALGAMMRSTGRIYAFDVEDKRLKKLKPRLARSGLSNVYSALIQHENDTAVKRLHGKIDKLLLDVPCSGIGTLRRNPDLKWRQNLQSLEELNQKQRSILQQASKVLKSGGQLVYATCSLLKQENEDIVQEFLANNEGFKLVNIKDVLLKQNINIESLEDDYLRLYPHVHSTDGFFAALIQKV
jgi:16S rRNA (cytosine967-C5)-methyltransferase